MSTPNELQKIKRYYLHNDGECSEFEKGDWVNWSDIEPLIRESATLRAEADAAIARLEPILRSHEALREALEDLLATARSASWAHITNATKDDPCRCKGCSLKKAKSALAAAKEVSQ